METRFIRSLHHPFVKYFLKLREDKAFRYGEKKVVVMGKKILADWSKDYPIEILLSSDEEAARFLPSKERYLVTQDILKKITALSAPEPLVAVVPMPSWQDVSKAKHLLVLDKVADPGNLGTLLRTALALGWDGVFLTDDSCDPFNDKAMRAAKGATFRLPMQKGSIEELCSLVEKGEMAVYVADIHGADCTTLSYGEPLALILGNESCGPNPILKEKFTRIAISMKNMESLNVASAGAILLYHLKGFS